MTRTLTLALTFAAACDQPTDFDPALDCPSLDELVIDEAEADEYADATFDIMATAYGPLVAHLPARKAAMCTVTETDPFVVTCSFTVCGMTMSTEVSHPAGLGTYTLTMRNPCG